MAVFVRDMACSGSLIKIKGLLNFSFGLISMVVWIFLSWIYYNLVTILIKKHPLKFSSSSKSAAIFVFDRSRERLGSLSALLAQCGVHGASCWEYWPLSTLFMKENQASAGGCRGDWENKVSLWPSDLTDYANMAPWSTVQHSSSRWHRPHPQQLLSEYVRAVHSWDVMCTC